MDAEDDGWVTVHGADTCMCQRTVTHTFKGITWCIWCLRFVFSPRRAPQGDQ